MSPPDDDEGHCVHCGTYITQDSAPSRVWRDEGNWRCPKASDGVHQVAAVVTAWQRLVDHEADMAADHYQSRCGW